MTSINWLSQLSAIVGIVYSDRNANAKSTSLTIPTARGALRVYIRTPFRLVWTNHNSTKVQLSRYRLIHLGWNLFTAHFTQCTNMADKWQVSQYPIEFLMHIYIIAHCCIVTKSFMVAHKQRHNDNNNGPIMSLTRNYLVCSSIIWTSKSSVWLVLEPQAAQRD